MELADVQRIHKEHWRPGVGSVTPEEVLCFQEVIAKHRPRSFLEVGTASGLSGGLIALVMEENGGERFVTLDISDNSIGDPTKETGFLLPAVHPGGAVEVVRRPLTVAADVPGFGEEFDMGFVDANHQHPWPLLDTLCVYPVLRGPRLLFHHDLDLYRKQTQVLGVGPKHLYDQFPESHRRRFEANHGNLFLLSLDLPVAELERIAIDAMYLPWSLRFAIGPRRRRAIRTVLETYYSADLLAAFDESVERFNVPWHLRGAVPSADGDDTQP